MQVVLGSEYVQFVILYILYDKFISDGYSRDIRAKEVLDHPELNYLESRIVSTELDYLAGKKFIIGSSSTGHSPYDWVRISSEGVEIIRFIIRDFPTKMRESDDEEYKWKYNQISATRSEIGKRLEIFAFVKGHISEFEDYLVSTKAISLHPIPYNTIKLQVGNTYNSIPEPKSVEHWMKPIFGECEGNIDDNLVFTLMPFKPELDTIYKIIIKPVVQSKNLICKRADDYMTNNPIIKDVWNAICRARIIIADITTLNPNVMYELGIAHTLGKDVIMVYQRLENESTFPFDIYHIRRIQYRNDAAGSYDLQANLSRTLDYILNKNKIHDDEETDSIPPLPYITDLPSETLFKPTQKPPDTRVQILPGSSSPTNNRFYVPKPRI